jgi:glutathione synthase/RimK-type ligase-like ATP-grasp enzyme
MRISLAQANSIRVCIVSFSGDAHAEIISSILERKHAAYVKIIHPDQCQDIVSLNYGTTQKNNNDIYDVIWIRRKNFLNVKLDANINFDFAINCAQSSQDALDAFISQSAHRFINPIDKALKIENKAIQLRISESAGLSTPLTLISTSHTEIMEFESNCGPLVIKSMRSIGGAPTGTFLFNRQLISPENCMLAPAIYQEQICGSKHLRVVVFGSKVLPFEYESNNVDSRFDARNGANLVEITENLRSGILRFMEISGLKMGVFDFKKSDAGEWYFLEVNQQGAFAYLDPLSGYPILLDFAKFIIDEANIT